MGKITTYKEAGVNIVLGDDASQVLYEAAKLTWKNRKDRLGEVVQIFDDFSGLRGVDVGGLPDGTFTNLGFDGVGTKIELAERLKKHDTVANDLFAMVCDDVVVRGAEPVLVGSMLDVNSLGTDKESHMDFVKQLAVGYVNAAREAGVAVVNGEVAELGARVQGYFPLPGFFTRLGQSINYLFRGKLVTNPGFYYNWGAGVAWFAQRDRLLTGYEIKEGDSLVGLREDGFRSNGLSLVRRIMEQNYGRDWHEIKLLSRAVLFPSKIYTRAVVNMFGGYDGEPKAEIHGIAHITGGGIPNKLGRVLKPSGLGAYLDDPFFPPKIMTYCQEKGGVSDEEAYRTWNMGQGMIVITPKPDDVINRARGYDIDAQVIGTVVKSPGIRIKNRGYFKSGCKLDWLKYD